MNIQQIIDHYGNSQQMETNFVSDHLSQNNFFECSRQLDFLKMLLLRLLQLSEQEVKFAGENVSFSTMTNYHPIEEELSSYTNDLSLLFKDFDRARSLRFEDFCSCWRNLNFSFVHWYGICIWNSCSLILIVHFLNSFLFRFGPGPIYLFSLCLRRPFWLHQLLCRQLLFYRYCFNLGSFASAFYPGTKFLPLGHLL